MTEAFHAQSLGSGPDPLRVAAAWPESRPLAALLSARGGSELARWSVIAAPTGTRTIETPEADALGSSGLLDRIDSMVSRRGGVEPTADPEIPPFRGGSLLTMSYELGRELEPRARHVTDLSNGDEPLLTILDCPNALVHDRDHDRWWLVGDPDTDPGLADLLFVSQVDDSRTPACTILEAVPGDRDYAERVARTIEYVHAGDIFQANITRDFVAGVDTPTIADRRALATDLLKESGAWFGAILEYEACGIDRTVVSLSPELFLSLDPVDSVIRTRPIKGTLPAGADPGDLERSEKDAAELAMIVDLMRNDLGRICERGSVRVTRPRTIETHPGVIHGVAEITGRIPESVGFGRLMSATFPPGSITGAPKVRAMQIIEELERRPRGVYCGALGFVSDCGRVELDVSIRTLELRPSGGSGGYSHTLRYGAGCGIVADSTPEGETAESHAKAALLSRYLETRSDRTPLSSGNDLSTSGA